MTRRRLAVVLCTLAALTVAGCSADGPGGSAEQKGHSTAIVANLDPEPIAPNPTPQLPVTVRGFDGTEVTVTDVSRIVAIDLYGTLAQTVYGLGLGDNLVGRSTAASFPAVQDVPNVTAGGQSVNIEAVAALRPTVILTDASIGDATLRDQLKAVSGAVVLFDSNRTVDGVGPYIESVAIALGVPTEGRKLAERTTQEIDAAIEGIDKPDKPIRVAFVYLRGTSVAFLAGPGSGADSLIAALGAEDAGTASGLTSQFVPVNSEAMIAAAPDVFLTMSKGLETVGGPEGLEKLPGVGQTPAGRNQRVVDMDDGAILSFGPSTGHVLAALADAIYHPAE
ncbi:ABC transporter substrate-binding protein [Antrihabitans sp. YC2-6]|uniref:heme/hemin ABC transporter substrate-binding protein n=1 Tax=Antrihabitans sp. YC2-6 TaxID=2799498 RepID=UPI0018F2BE42|nr:ABC transporter substrate-binding protein [Antrihabitans sp. YC2-6]MBJ8345633.1 ABC transporter substrate-binding protein [Antrihabitans sp. YC2-6]